MGGGRSRLVEASFVPVARSAAPAVAVITSPAPCVRRPLPAESNGRQGMIIRAFRGVGG